MRSSWQHGDARVAAGQAPDRVARLGTDVARTLVPRATLALLVILGLSGATHAGIQISSGRGLIVIAIGVDTGPVPSKFAAKDAAAFAAVLGDLHPRKVDGQASAAYRQLFDAVSAKTLAEPDRKSVLAAFQEVVAKASAEDTFVFFFAGPGAWVEGQGEQPAGYHLGLAGGPRRDEVVWDLVKQDLREFGVPLSSLFAILRQVPCQSKLIVLDCGVESGKAIDELVSFEQRGESSLGKSVALWGLAGDSIEIERAGHGLLTCVLLEGLGGAADRALGPRHQDGTVTARELEAFCYGRLPAGVDETRNEQWILSSHPRTYFRGPDFALHLLPDDPALRGSDAGERGGPKIEVVSPATQRGLDLETPRKTLRLEFRVTDPLGVHDAYTGIKRGEQLVRQDAELGADGLWRAEVPLAFGENALVVGATNLSLNATQLTFKVVRSAAGPVLERTGRSGRDHALLIAIDDYEHWTPLKSPIRDAKALDQVLRETYGFSVEMLPNPTKRELLTKIREYVTRDFGDEDQLLVFFAGHGQLDPLTDIGYLVAKDSARGDQLGESYISHLEFVKIMDRIRCPHTLVMLDSCFGGAAFEAAIQKPRGDGDFRADLPEPELIAKKLSHRSRKLVTSGGKEYVWDGGTDGHSPFATRLLEALRSREAKRSVLTLTEAVTYLERAKPGPIWGGIGGDEPGSDFLFIPK